MFLTQLVWSVTTLLAVAAAAIAAFLWRTRARDSSFFFPDRSFVYPEPEGRRPYVGHLFFALRHLDHLYDALLDYARKFKKPYLISLPTISMPHPGILVVFGPDNLRHLLKDKFDNYPKGDTFIFVKELFGEGIFGVDGDLWKRQRKIASHQFATKVLTDDVASMSHRNSRKVADKLSALIKAGNGTGITDMQDLMYRYTFETICDVAFGGELDAINRQDVPFMYAFDKVQRMSIERLFNPIWKVQRMFSLGNESVLRAELKRLEEFTHKVISKRLAENPNILRKYPDLLSRFILENMSNTEETAPEAADKDADAPEDGPTEKRISTKEPVTHKQLHDLILNFMIAGRDTTAALLSWSLYRITQHPDVEAKLLAEIANATQDMNAADESSDGMSMYRAMQKLTYMEAFLLEVLRIHPSVPTDGKIAMEDDVLPDGTPIKKGMMVLYSIYAQNHMEEYWGADVEIFRPERFLEKEKLDSDTFLYPSFNAGPRICLGKRVALLEAKIMLYTLLPRFRFRLNCKKEDIDYMFTIILVMKKGLPCVITERQ